MPSSRRVVLPLGPRSSIGWDLSTLKRQKQRHRNRHDTNARWSCPLRRAEWTNSPVELVETCSSCLASSVIPRRLRRSSCRSRCLRLCWAREILAIALFKWAIVGSGWWSCKSKYEKRLVRILFMTNIYIHICLIILSNLNTIFCPFRQNRVDLDKIFKINISIPLSNLELWDLSFASMATLSGTPTDWFRSSWDQCGYQLLVRVIIFIFIHNLYFSQVRELCFSGDLLLNG